jgi:hypothetical protein
MSNEVVKLIDDEIIRLQEARSVLVGKSVPEKITAKVLLKSIDKGDFFKDVKPRRRGITAEGRARIAAAQKLRWKRINATKKKETASV